MIQIRYGDVNQTVRVLQYLLGITVDGDFGPKTLNAVKAFQLKNKLVVDGIIGHLSWGKLAAIQKQIQIGSTGNAVKAVQTIIGVTVDGKFGPLTCEVAKEIQEAGGLVKDGKIGIKTWNYLLTKYEIKPSVVYIQEVVDFKQGDKRWGKVVFTSCNNKKQTIANSGCGPTAAADMLATWFGNQYTPDVVAKMVVDHGYRTKNNGIAFAFFDWLAKQFPFKSYKHTDSTSEVCKALTNGAIVIAAMGPGFFTKEGHIICLKGYAPETQTIYVNDPSSSTRKSYSYSGFAKEEREYFIYTK